MAKKSIKKNTESEEEIEARSIKNLNPEFIREPTIRYKVGERVTHGRVKISHVTKVLLDGKILKLHQTCTNNNYGRPFDYERDLYIAWHDITPYQEQDSEKWDESKAIKKNRQRLQFSQRDISSLIHTHYSFGVDFEPDYQRGLVWELEDKVNLIESIFNDVDIGKFVIHSRPYAPNIPLYEIVDGKQRLSTLIDFFENRFKWRGKLYYELHPSDRNFFCDYPVSLAEIPETADRKQILETFVRLNTAGKPQNIEHLEKVKKLLNGEK